MKIQNNGVSVESQPIMNFTNASSITVDHTNARLDVVLPGGAGSGAPVGASYLVGSADATLTAERVVTDTASVTWDLSVAAQAKANVPGGAFETAGAVAAHVAAADPHTQYMTQARMLARASLRV